MTVKNIQSEIPDVTTVPPTITLITNPAAIQKQSIKTCFFSHLEYKILIPTYANIHKQACKFTHIAAPKPTTAKSTNKLHAHGIDIFPDAIGLFFFTSCFLSFSTSLISFNT